MKNTDKVYKVQEIVRDQLFGDYFLRVPKGLELTKEILENSNRLWEVDLEDIDVSFSEVDNDKKTLTNTTRHSGSIPIYSLDEDGEITFFGYGF